MGMARSRLIREGLHALLCALLTYVLLFQLLMTAMAGGLQAANLAMGLDRLGVICSSGDGQRTDQNSPANPHNSKKAGCCTWGCAGGSPDIGSGNTQVAAPMVFAAINVPVALPVTRQASQPPETRRQQPRAPPILI
jgi:hypothetical protein